VKDRAGRREGRSDRQADSGDVESDSICYTRWLRRYL